MKTRKNQPFGRAIALSLIAMALVIASLSDASPVEKRRTISPEKVASLIQTTTDVSRVSSPFIDVAAAVQRSVVGVNQYQQDPRDHSLFGWPRNDAARDVLASTGSGVVIYEDFVLTNYHVVEGASAVTVMTLGDDSEKPGEIVGVDETKDIAIIYVKELGIPAVALGDSDQLQVGEWAICIGNPLGTELAGTVTVGIVSALNREIRTRTSTDRYGLKKAHTITMIQTNAAINSGNSGGGLFNVLGQLMGIPSMKYTGNVYSNTSVEGIGMAIPINVAKPLIQQVLRGEVEEEVKNDPLENSERPRLGVNVSTISASNNRAVAQGLLPSGALVIDVTQGGPADRADIRPYDIIVELNGAVIASVSDLQQALTGVQGGDLLSVKVYRAEGLEGAEYESDIGAGNYWEMNVSLDA